MVRSLALMASARFLPLSVLAISLPLGAQAYDRIPVKPKNPLIADRAFNAFQKELRVAVERRDRPAIYSLLAKGFKISRDFGGAFDPKASSRKNFDAVMPGWDALAQFLRAQSFAPAHGFPKANCGPAPLDAKTEKRIDAAAAKTVPPSEAAFEWAYVETGNVPVYSNSSTKARVLGTLSFEAVHVIKGDADWPFVAMPSGTKGFVRARDLTFLLSARLCYAKVKGEWRIVGYVGGGD